MTALSMADPPDKEKRFDLAIAMCEKAWEKLREHGYGEAKERGSSVVEKLKSTTEYTDSFEKAWQMYAAKSKGEKGRAFGYWEAIDPELYKWIYHAIPIYVTNVQDDKRCHFSTFLSKKYWEGYPLKKEKSKPVYDESLGEKKALELLGLAESEEKPKPKEVNTYLKEELGKLAKGVKL